MVIRPKSPPYKNERSFYRHRLFQTHQVEKRLDTVGTRQEMELQTTATHSRSAERLLIRLTSVAGASAILGLRC